MIDDYNDDSCGDEEHGENNQEREAPNQPDHPVRPVARTGVRAEDLPQE
jgi:hypothetical protein